MIKNPGMNRTLWILAALLSLIAALVGVFNPGVYEKVVADKYLPGVISQDIVTIFAALVLLLLSFRFQKGNVKKHLVILGILSYLFYGYGIYVIERLYNSLYLVYAAIFGLSFYAIVYGVASISKEAIAWAKMSNFTRYLTAIFLLIVPLIFVPLWIGQLLPLMQTGEKIEFLYAVYILDLCFLMPLFVIGAIMSLNQNGLGLLVTPALLINVFAVLFPVGLGEVLKPLYDLKPDTGGLGLYFGIAVVFLALAILSIRKLDINRIDNAR